MIKIETHVPGFCSIFTIEQSLNELFLLIEHAKLGERLQLFEMMAKSLSDASQFNELLRVKLNKIKKEL